MKHHITYEVNINGILYKNLTEEFRSEIIDFYFEVFLKGKCGSLDLGIIYIFTFYLVYYMN